MIRVFKECKCGTGPKLAKAESGMRRVLCPTWLGGCGAHTPEFKTIKAALHAWDCGDVKEKR